MLFSPQDNTMGSVWHCLISNEKRLSKEVKQ